MNRTSLLEKPEYYHKLVDFVRYLYKGEISNLEAHEAARNLINLHELLLEIESKQTGE